MSDKELKAEKENRYFAAKAGIIVALCALLLPCWVYCGPFDLFIYAGGWMFHAYDADSTTRISFSLYFAGFSLLQALIIIGGPQLLFAYMLYRLYLGQTSVKKALATGCIVLIPPLINDLFYLIIYLTSPSAPFWPTIPIPLSLLVGLVIIKRYPPPEDVPTWLQ
ncbi:MAG: hypothetical protein R6V83_10600 [Candidatus Thorarchaeota archaeon]